MAKRSDFAEEMGSEYAELGQKIGRAKDQGVMNVSAKEAAKLVKKAQKAAKKPSEAEQKARQRRMEMIRQGGVKKQNKKCGGKVKHMKKGGKTKCRGMGAALRGGSFREC